MTITESIAIAIVTGLISFFVVNSFTKDNPPPARVDVHIIKESNIICITYRQTMQCFAYADEGTTLYVQPEVAI